MTTLGSSIICMDHINFERDVKICEKVGIDYLHLDVMDGDYVPRYGIYPEIVERMADVTNLPMDLHLMVSDPTFAIKQFSQIPNIEYISIHIDDNAKNFYAYTDQIKSSGKKAGLVINLSSDLSHVAQLIDTTEIDSIMFMGIHPGVLIQEARPTQVIKNIKFLEKALVGNLPLFVQCDGGVNFNSIPHLKAAGINNFICGSSTLYQGVNNSFSNEERFDQVKKNFELIQVGLN